MKATSVPLGPRASASAQVRPSTPESEKSRAFQPKSQMPGRVVAMKNLRMDALRDVRRAQSAPLHHDRQAFGRARDAGIEPARAAVRKGKRFVEQDDVVPLRALGLVHREHVAEVELVIALALLPRDLLEPAGKAFGADSRLENFCARIVLRPDAYSENLAAQARALHHGPQAAIEQAPALVVAQAHELVALHRQCIGQAAALAHALIVGAPCGIA